MIVMFLPALIAIIGLLMYALSANPKIVRIGEILFFCGTLVTLFSLKGMVHIP